MLHLKTIYPKTLGLLKKISSIPQLSEFNLAGGTSLSLQIGHRISVDLDFFGKSKLPNEIILDYLSDFSSPKIILQSPNILILDIDKIKVDFVKYKYPLLKSPKKIDGLRLLRLEDISAMKLAAIIGRGKKRDFFDIYFLLSFFELKKMIEFYNEKYKDGSEFILARSLIYFDDAEGEEIPNVFGKATWEEVKNKILQEVKKIY